jgi:excisionase family DNA binding protein
MELRLVLSDAQLDALAARVATVLAEQQPADDGYLSSDDAAKFLGCPRSRIHDLVGLGKLAACRDGRALRFRKADLRAYLEDQR